MTVQLLSMGRRVCMAVNMAIYFMVSKYSLSLIPDNILCIFSTLLCK